MSKNDFFNVLGIYRHRMGTDGKGVTTLIALSGCPLNCKFCINKEIISRNKYKEYSKEELLRTIMQDYCYFMATGGGITFGGAEPLLQSKQILDFSKLLPKGICLNVETSMNIDFTTLGIDLDDVFNNITKFFIDIKNVDKEIYKKYTGIDNSLVIKNLESIANLKHQDKCCIRIPIIPGYVSQDDIVKSIEFVENLGFQELDIFKYKI